MLTQRNKLFSSPYSQLQAELTLPSPVKKITSSWFLSGENIDVFCKRDDLIHKTISGNKWRKLMPLAAQLNEQLAAEPKSKNSDSTVQAHILSFGGGYSNHLHALAYMCHRLNVKLTAVIRGDYSHSPTPMLNDLHRWGASCHFVTKIDYKKRTEPEYVSELKATFNANIVVPEGGSNADCLAGVAGLVDEYRQQTPAISHVVLPVASGGTLAGIVSGIAQQELLSANKALGHTNTQVIGIAALKSSIGQAGANDTIGYLESSVINLLNASKNNNHLTNVSWHIEHGFHHGGYAKSSSALRQFMTKFTEETAIEVETVYSGKCFYALHQMIKQGCFAANSRVLAIHTGGMQGARAK
jgi:1-aminocyclopropane-1-carboxylate deaminase